jgi:protein disulfide-isomerase
VKGKVQLIIVILFLSTALVSQTKIKKSLRSEGKSKMSTTKMKVEIWSDIMCPFCYIGKRHYEAALKQFSDSNKIELEWHSFQLDPNIPKQTEKVSVYKYLADRKGMSVEQSKQMHGNVVEMAKAAGLTYDFDKAVVANSFDAHRLIQLAKKNHLGDEAEERLFKAYFTEGKDMGNHQTLIELGKEIGLNEAEVKEVLESDAFTAEVNKDVQEAQHIGVTGVPFFVFDRKYALSGAQPSSAFLDVLNKSFAEWQKSNPNSDLKVSEGKVCTPDKDCK